ncbi:branched-chain amino acid transport [Thiopseudomonas alkaliphila]|uniref:Branched-chain amino acid transport n=1 Tax=Thiopseudomonas alkaliphila TaxID=1697053 RepID=A0A0K1XFL1_9GAMM|nr:AzlD domain-containing protein [Thiopseudomonas alkaliphila]AKX60111.1 branched-chain amino acid transport [Thiopseudomonas alkaliphila]
MKVWLSIVGMALITFVIRYSFFAFPQMRFSSKITQALNYVPISVLTSIIVPGLVMPEGEWALQWSNAYLLAGIGCIVIAASTRHTLLTIGGGMALFMLLRYSLG